MSKKLKQGSSECDANVFTKEHFSQEVFIPENGLENASVMPHQAH